jgi:hypothetical protein
MKIYVIRNIIKQVICWILLLQMINISIDPPDFKHPKHSSVTNKKALSIEETESFYELIAEGVFDKEVPESNEDEIDTSSPSFELYLITRICTKLPALAFPVEHFPQYYTSFSSINQEPHSPPPKFA